ncbi:hypothetical protein [Natronorubrum daqingense]|uniref:Uncharacterized protein n=1 Tax=Natronorubrum daqingense TaxID=588898 RepID=A0A1N7AAF8_9EURY|nr:hypothetical protein [Natronorubrum daqingense]APX98056.1 hypothetical protein BB347_16340 [Natronorubrum daqingense]SIR36036.1 hypothetical protein SAMN05421809_1092 [Natronorubrum daqingense]
MDEVKAYTAAFLLIALSLPLVSYGSTNGVEALSTLGFVAIIAAGCIPLVVRYAERLGASS